MNTKPRNLRFSLTAQMSENAFHGTKVEHENYLAECDWERDDSLDDCRTRMVEAEI